MKNQQYKISALERDERAIRMPAKIPLGKALKALREAILESFRTGSTWEIVQVCNDQLKPLLDAQTELAYLKGGRRIQLTSEKVLSESKKEYAPVRFSLSDDDETATRGVADYLRKISGVDPSNFSDSFAKHNAGAIGNLASAICDEVKKAQIDLTLAGIHVKGGKAEIARILAKNGVQAPNLGALAETLFRTHTQQAYSAGRWNTATAPDFADEIWGFEYVTAHDPRVREGHRVLDGVRLPKEDDFWKKYFPPNGWNCRCTTLDIWYDDAEAKINFGVTGRDPRKRAPEEMDVSKEFQGNVGIFANPEPMKSTPMPSPETGTPTASENNVTRKEYEENTKKTAGGGLTPTEENIKITDAEIRATLSTVRAYYGAQIADRLKIVRTSTGCDIFLDGEKVAKVEIEAEKDGVQFARAPKRYVLITDTEILEYRTLWLAVKRILDEEVETEMESPFPNIKHFVKTETYREKYFSRIAPVSKQMRKELRDKKPWEQEIVRYFINTRHIVRLVEECSYSTYDAEIDGVPTEFKTITGNNNITARNRIEKAILQRATNIVLDIRKKEISRDIANQIISLVLEKHGVLSIDVEIWTVKEQDGVKKLVKYIYRRK